MFQGLLGVGFNRQPDRLVPVLMNLTVTLTHVFSSWVYVCVCVGIILSLFVFTLPLFSISLMPDSKD